MVKLWYILQVGWLAFSDFLLWAWELEFGFLFLILLRFLTFDHKHLQPTHALGVILLLPARLIFVLPLNLPFRTLQNFPRELSMTGSECRATTRALELSEGPRWFLALLSVRLYSQVLWSSVKRSSFLVLP